MTSTEKVYSNIFLLYTGPIIIREQYDMFPVLHTSHQDSLNAPYMWRTDLLIQHIGIAVLFCQYEHL